MSDLRTTIRRILGYHLPDAKDYTRGVKICTCGHEVPIGDMQARQEHLIDVLVAGLSSETRCPDDTACDRACDQQCARLVAEEAAR